MRAGAPVSLRTAARATPDGRARPHDPVGRECRGPGRRLSRHLESYVAPFQADPSADAVVARASAAQRAIGDPAAWPEPRLDGLLVAIGSSISRHAEELADLTMADTGISNITDKAIKIRFTAHDVVSGC